MALCTIIYGVLSVDENDCHCFTDNRDASAHTVLCSQEGQRHKITLGPLSRPSLPCNGRHPVTRTCYQKLIHASIDMRVPTPWIPSRLETETFLWFLHFLAMFTQPGSQGLSKTGVRERGWWVVNNCAVSWPCTGIEQWGQWSQMLKTSVLYSATKFHALWGSQTLHNQWCVRPALVVLIMTTSYSSARALRTFWKINVYYLQDLGRTQHNWGPRLRSWV